MTTDGIDTERFTDGDSSPDSINTRVFLDQVFFLENFAMCSFSDDPATIASSN